MFVIINRIGFYENEFISATICSNQPNFKKYSDLAIYRKADHDLKLWKVLRNNGSNNEQYEAFVFNDLGILNGAIINGELVEYQISNGIERLHIKGTILDGNELKLKI